MNQPIFPNLPTQHQVLITGAAGFIGSHLVDHYLKAGWRVLGVDNLLTGRWENLNHLLDKTHHSTHPSFTFIQADVIQPPESYIPKSFAPDLVLHFASPASPPKYQKYPVGTYLVNSIGTHQLLQWLAENHSKARFLFASTSEVYGDPQVHPQTEDYWGNVNPNGLRSCYDEAKRLGETICGVHARDFKMDVRIVRIFNTYGPRIDPSDGRIVPNLITQALKHQPLTIYGDGKQTRSYCYVDDLVAGIMKLADHPAGAGKTVNIGNPEELTILDTAELVKELTHQPDLKLDFRPLPSDDPTRRKPDITQAKELLGWQPQVSFKSGLERTIKHFSIV
jgi:nucleoside-diphosphate-sugar epimerase